jgi:hypothetical protein
MNFYRLSKTIDTNPNALGLSEDSLTLIKYLADRTEKTYGESFIELVKVDWNLYEAFCNIENAKEKANETD